MGVLEITKKEALLLLFFSALFLIEISIVSADCISLAGCGEECGEGGCSAYPYAVGGDCCQGDAGDYCDNNDECTGHDDCRQCSGGTCTNYNEGNGCGSGNEICYDADSCDVRTNYSNSCSSGECSGSSVTEDYCASCTVCNGQACGSGTEVCYNASSCDVRTRKNTCEQESCTGSYTYLDYCASCTVCDNEICSSVDHCSNDGWYTGKKCASEDSCTASYGYTECSACVTCSGGRCDTNYTTGQEDTTGNNTCSGTCVQCDGAGSCTYPSDDSGCGTIDCDGLNYYFNNGTQSPTSTQNCYLKDYADITSNRCEGINDCKDPNSGDCTSYSNDFQYSCATCKYINTAGGICQDQTLGSCSDYGTSDLCGSNWYCTNQENTDNAYNNSYFSYETQGYCDGSGSCDYSGSGREPDNYTGACECEFSGTQSTCNDGETGCWISSSCCGDDSGEDWCHASGGYQACYDGYWGTDGDNNSYICNCGEGAWFSSKCCGDDGSSDDFNGNASNGCCCDGSQIATGNDERCSGYSNYWCIDGIYCTSGGGLVRDPDEGQSTVDGDNVACGCVYTDEYICDDNDADATADGMCGSGTGCTTGIFSLSGGTYYAGCSAGRECDSNIASPTAYNYMAEGVCLTSGSCDTNDAVKDGASYYGNCYNHGGAECDHNVSNPTVEYIQDGLCWSAGCLTSGYIFYDGTQYDKNSNVATEDYNYSLDSDGKGCDNSGDWSGGHNFTADGMVTNDSLCTSVGSSVRVEAENNNYFVAGCDNSGDMCDSSISSSLSNPWMRDGYCCDNACNLDRTLPNGSNCCGVNAICYSGNCNSSDVCSIHAYPDINSISALPSPQGFGENVTITANITDNNGQDDIDTVLVGITPPGEAETNYSMNNISSEIWQYKFTDFTNGTYTYIIYVNDSIGLWASDSGLSEDTGTFVLNNVLYVNIITIKDVYTDNELVYIT